MKATQNKQLLSTSKAGTQAARSHNESTELAPETACAYQTPVLVCYGDVRDVTLGPTLGEGESGCAGIFRPGPGGCPGP